MVYNFDGFNYLIRLDKHETLHDCLQRFATETNIQGGWISGLGGALAMTLGFYDLSKKIYKYKDFKGAYEVISIQGNIARDESKEPVFHMHGTFADANYAAFGGHIKDITVAATLELFVHRSYQPVKRRLDDVVGLKVLDL